MREIKFRGKKVNGSGWIFGMPNYQMTHIFNNSQVDSVDNYEVIPETIGQFTGLPCRYEDGSSGELFKGDVLRDYMSEIVGVVDWHYDMWVVKVNLPCEYKRIGSWGDWIKIGNIHDNPELLTQN